MISIEEMRRAEGHRVAITYESGKIVNLFCEEYVQAEDDEDEPMLFMSNKLAILQSEIKKIEIVK